MRVKVTKNEVDVIARETGLLKFRILSEMVVWTPNLRTLVNLAEQEYNELRSFVGENYPKGKCKRIIQLFQLLKEGKVREVKGATP
jgi:hypothetical protein